MAVSVSPPARPPRPAKAGAVARVSLTPEAWVEAATEVLVDHGMDQIRIDDLARQLRVTRGSFYWHFRDREDLLQRVLAHWRLQATEDLTRRLEAANPDPRAQLRDVLTLPFRGRAAARAARVELAIRAWARGDPAARVAVDEADANRVSYIAQLFSQLGFGVAEARLRAQLLYALLLAESVAPALVHPANRKALAQFTDELLASKQPVGQVA